MRFLKSFISGLFTFIFGVLIVLIICVFSVSAFANRDNIVKNMKKADILTEVHKIRNSGSAEGSNGVAQVIDEMYFLASQFSVSEEIVDKIIDSDITKEIVGDTVGNMTDYIVNGEDTKVLSEDDIYKLIDDNLDEVLKENDLSIDDGQKEKFLREVEKQLPDIVKVIPSSSELLGSDYGEEIRLIQEIFGVRTKVILCVCLFISGLIVIILKRKHFEWCANLGVALLISGLVLMGIALAAPSLFVSMIGASDLSMFASSLTEFLTKPILYSGFGVVALAIILFIVYKVLEKKLA